MSALKGMSLLLKQTGALIGLCEQSHNLVRVFKTYTAELGTGFQMMASGDLCRKLRHRD